MLRAGAAMDRSDDTAELTEEDLQRIRHQQWGGFGELGGPSRAYHHALRKIPPPRITFQWSEIRDLHSASALKNRGLTVPPKRRRRSSTLIQYQKRQTVCRLYRNLALAALETLTTPLPPVDRATHRRKQRTMATVFRQRRVSAETRRLVQRVLSDQRGNPSEQRRAYRKATLDAFYRNVRQLLDDYTTLRGDRRVRKIGEIVAALNLGSREVAAVQKRFERMPAAMKPTRRRKPRR